MLKYFIFLNITLIKNKNILKITSILHNFHYFNIKYLLFFFTTKKILITFICLNKKNIICILIGCVHLPLVFNIWVYLQKQLKWWDAWVIDTNVGIFKIKEVGHLYCNHNWIPQQRVMKQIKQCYGEKVWKYSNVEHAHQNKKISFIFHLEYKFVSVA